MPYGHLLRDIADEANKRDALLVALAAAYVPFRNVPRDGLPSPMVALLAAVQAAIANAPPLAAGAPAQVPHIVTAPQVMTPPTGVIIAARSSAVTVGKG
jgi:hypothetical protein